MAGISPSEGQSLDNKPRQGVGGNEGRGEEWGTSDSIPINNTHGEGKENRKTFFQDLSLVARLGESTRYSRLPYRLEGPVSILQQANHPKK